MNIYITLDYELFLGSKPGTPQNCLINPMRAMMEILAKSGTRLTVLVDGAYLYRMWQLKEKYKDIENDYQSVLDNIKDIHLHGHSVQFHFHPQWLYSEYEEGKGWIMDFDHYKLSDVPMDVLSMAFCKSIGIIEGITGKKICVFRAGGYSLCEYEWYGKLFYDNGIVLDTSVIPGVKVKSKFQEYDYTKAPKKSIYPFKEDVCKETSGDNETFIEMPISVSGKMPSFYYLMKKRKLLSMYNPEKVYGDGIGVGTQLTRWQSLFGHLKKFFGMVRMTASIDNFSSAELIDVYNYNRDRENENLVVIGHPKAATDESLRNLEVFVEKALLAGDEFHTMDEVAVGLKSV